jgi:lipoprotein-anchoring transpeptidase ErfK/SrfK
MVGVGSRRKIFFRCLAACLLAALFASCSRGLGDSGRPRISVYSTAYLTEDNQVVYSVRSGPRPKPTPRPDTEWTWTGDGVLGEPSIEIDLGSQTATFYKGRQPVGLAPVSTGREGYGTPTGDFKVIQKNKTHVSNLYGDYVDSSGNVVKSNVGVNRDRRPPGAVFRGAPMPFFMRIHGAVGMHAGYLPGYPASHGCIRLPRGAAQRFFENAPLGTPVRVFH